LLYSGSPEYNSRSTAASSWKTENIMKNGEGWEAFCHIWIASYKSRLRHLLHYDEWRICGTWNSRCVDSVIVRWTDNDSIFVLR
jgi:hypothetical protein